jgi:hypothetical protein
LNRRHADFQSAALPTELSGRRIEHLSRSGWRGDTSAARGCPEAFSPFLPPAVSHLKFGEGGPHPPDRAGCLLPLRALESHSFLLAIAPDQHRRSGANKRGDTWGQFLSCRSDRSRKQPSRHLDQGQTVTLSGQFIQAQRCPACQIGLTIAFERGLDYLIQNGAVFF